MIINRTQEHNGVVTILQVADVPVTSKAVHKATLMKEDCVKLSFNSDVDYKFKAGDWIIIENGGLPYYLPDDYFPTMKDEATFSYELQFNAPWYNLDKYMFLFNTYQDSLIVKRESDWYITDTAQNILALIIRCTNDETRACQCRFNEILDCEPTVAKTFTFSSTSVLAALNNLAKEFELEWWVTYEGGQFYLHFGECDNSVVRDNDGGVIFSDGVRTKDSSLRTELTAGVNVSNPSVSQRQGLKRFYYVFGSSRNIDQNATQDMANGFVTSIVTKRLEMAGNPQDMHEGSGEEVVIFDDIYPRSDYQITGVTPIEIVSDEIVSYNQDGSPIFKRYNVYNLQIKDFSDYIFHLIETDSNVQNVEDIVASGKALSLKFISKDYEGVTNTPLLAGFEFELGAILCTNENTGDRWYEFQIIKKDVNGYIIPNDTLIPEVDDWVCIYNVKGAYIGGLNSNNGQDELQEAFAKWYANKKKDVSYTIKPYADEDIDLNIGDAVTLNYKDNSVVSRVYSFEKHLDVNIDASYTISSYAKLGSVNQLKEDVKILTASIANGTAGGSVDASDLSNAVATYGRRLFLSKTSDDAADGHIEFNEGLTSKKNASMEGGSTFGTFESGFLGSGACIDAQGNAEVKTLYSREAISTPEFRFNRVTVTEGEQWNTNGFGIIDEVIDDWIYLRLEDGDFPSVKFGDYCRGLYNNIGYADENGTQQYDLSGQQDYDDCNFPTKQYFFTSYFQVISDPVQGADGRWRFKYQTKSQQVSNNNSTPLPCKNMKFAQYGNSVNADRQASLYQTSIRHAYIQQLEGVNSWEIKPVNIVSRYGYLGDLTITLKDSDGNTYNRQLEGNGLYVQKNVYFGNATIQLDPVTLEDLKDKLASYSVYLSAYTDVIKVDDAGNVIDGLWKDTGSGNNVSRQYRIYSVITVRNGAEPLTIEERDVPIGKGYYKVYAEPHGCSCEIKNSTLYITGIDNVKDGVAGSSDDVWTPAQYEACRSVERVWVDLRVDCEGVGTIVETMPITIKHDPTPYIIADLTNENAGVSWSSEDEDYVGLPVETYINMAKGNENLRITNIFINTINGVPPQWHQPRWDGNLQAYIYEDTNENSATYGWKFYISHIAGNDNFPLAGWISIEKMPYDAESVTEILITCTTTYAGVSYERTLSLHITRVTDVAIWNIVPTHHSINVDRNAYFNFNNVGVMLFCTDNTGRHEVTQLPQELDLCYQITQVVGTDSYTAISSVPSGSNPSENGWYESDGNNGYIETGDTSPQVGKTYYSKETTYSTIVGSEVSMSNLSQSVLVSDQAYADTIKSVIFSLYNGRDLELLDREEVQIIREGLGGQGSTGPAGNGVQNVTDYYMRAKQGFTPNYPNTLDARPSSLQVEITNSAPSGWIPNVYTAPNETWPCVWQFTKYSYTQASDYDTRPHLLTTYTKDGRSIKEIHVYYLKTTIDNVHNVYRLDQENGARLEWIQDVFSAPDSDKKYVWRYFSFEYEPYTSSEDRYFYSPIELAAKFVEDGVSNQCAYKVFPEKVDGQDYTPTLDNVSTGANAPATNNSSWSFSTTGLVVLAGYALWMTQRTHKGTETYNNWGTPVRISGNKGEAGADGKNIEFIYKLTNDPNPTSADLPTLNENTDGFIPSEAENPTNTDLGWTNNPSGIGWHDTDDDNVDDTFYKYEWMCQRIKPAGNNQSWGNWVGPFVWSAYGDKGMDGDGVEYVFKLKDTKPNKPLLPVLVSKKGQMISRVTWYGDAYLENNVWLPKDWTPTEGFTFYGWENGYYNEQGEWIPSSLNDGYWSDDPTGVSKTTGETKEWVSVRKRVSGKWGDFSPAALWATYSETPDLKIIDGYWYIGNDQLLDNNGNPVKAEGTNGTGVRIKGHVDYYANNDIPAGESGKTTLQGVANPSAGDCWLVEASRYLFVYVGGNHDNWEDDWEDLGEFKGVKGDSAFMHIAWATGMLFSGNVMQHPVITINGVVQSEYFHIVQQNGIEYEWMGICTTDSVKNPSGADPDSNDDWNKYAWNHIKGKDGANYERVYMRTQVETAPSVVSSDPDSQQRTNTDDEYLPSVGNMAACQSFSSEFTDDPHGVGYENVNGEDILFKYEWMAERKKVDGQWQAFSDAKLWAVYAEDGQQGDSVTNVRAKYLKTTMAEGVTYTTAGWTYTFEIPDADRPYLWRYYETTVGNNNTFPSSACERIAVYSPTPNINLLDDTAFTSMAAMEAWMQTHGGVSMITYVNNDPHADPNSQYYNSDGEEYNNFFGVSTGTQGHNAYCGRFRGLGEGNSRYIILLQQDILNETITKIEPNKWYTLSYWVKGNYNSLFDVKCNAIDNSVGAKRYINGVEETANANNASGFQSKQWKYDATHNDYSTEWRQHTITFKTPATLSESSYYVRWNMYDRTNEHEIYICMPKLEIGLFATMYMDGQTNTKAFPIATDWELGVQYFAGGIGEPYINMVHHGNTYGHPDWFKCIRTHISSSENSPKSANGSLYWKQASWDGFIATGLLLAQEASIDNLVAKLLRTGAPLSPHVEMHDDVVEFYGTTTLPSIKLCTDDDGVGVLRFYDKDGNALYDLGPNGIVQQIDAEASHYIDTYRIEITSSTRIGHLVSVVNGVINPISYNSCTRYYLLIEGWKKINQIKKYNIAIIINSSNATSPSTWNGREYASRPSDSYLASANVNTYDQFIPDGWYSSPLFGPFEEIGLNGTLYYVEVHHFIKGVDSQTIKVYFVPSEVINNQSRANCYDENGNSYNNVQQLIDAQITP